MLVVVIWAMLVNTHTHTHRDILTVIYDKFSQPRVAIIFWYRNSRTFNEAEVEFSRTNSRRTFTAWTVLQQYLISISVITGQF